MGVAGRIKRLKLVGHFSFSFHGNLLWPSLCPANSPPLKPGHLFISLLRHFRPSPYSPAHPTCFRVGADEQVVGPGLEVPDLVPAVAGGRGLKDSLHIVQLCALSHHISAPFCSRPLVSGVSAVPTDCGLSAQSCGLTPTGSLCPQPSWEPAPGGKSLGLLAPPRAVLWFGTLHSGASWPRHHHPPPTAAPRAPPIRALGAAGPALGISATRVRASSHVSPVLME